MIKMFFLSLRHGYHVTDLNLYLMVNHVMEQSYHSLLISCPSILQPKRHHLVAESASLCNKGCPHHVFRCHLDQIIAREIVHEGKDFVLCGIVNQNINVGKRKVILGACYVQVYVVHTHPYLVVLLRYQNNVSNPLRIGGED